LNKAEKQALWSFIIIYTFSSLLLMSIIAILYYNKQIDSEKSVCNKDLQETVMDVEITLLKTQMDGKEFIFCPINYFLQVGLYDEKGKKIASNLTYDDIDFNNTISIKKKRIQKVKKLKTPIQNVTYIVAEDTSMPQNIKKLKYLIYLTMFVSLIFIAFIGYLLSRLLLKPVNEKFAQIDHFIKDSAHEINTPVTALLMSVSALKKKGYAEEKLLKHISISSKQISNIYNTLSYVAFNDIKEREKVVKFDLKKEVLKSIAFYKEIAEAKQIKIVDDLKSLYVNMDKESADKLINNLLSNAIKYSYNHKSVTISLNNNLLSINDEGIGISKENQQEILKRYKRGTELIGGFGIGLDIVNSICKEYNITLDIKSKIAHGSTFTLDFSKVV
jgi:two-component system OmpR family sensor kinase